MFKSIQSPVYFEIIILKKCFDADKRYLKNLKNLGTPSFLLFNSYYIRIEIRTGNILNY